MSEPLDSLLRRREVRVDERAEDGLVGDFLVGVVGAGDDGADLVLDFLVCLSVST